MIYTFLLSILVIASAILILAILMQAGKGGGLAANFGGAGSSSDSFLGSRQASNLLTKSSWTAGGVFLALSFVLSQWSMTGVGPPKSVLDDVAKQAAATQAAPPPATSNSPVGGLPGLIPVDTGSVKAAGTKAAPPGKAGDAKTPAKVPPTQN